MKGISAIVDLKDAYGTKLAIYEDGTSTEVFTNSIGQEYVSVKNKKSPDGSFSGRIRDAVEAVRAGEGDYITTLDLTLMGITVMSYLDRNVGEPIRKQSIDIWKDAYFNWCILVGFKGSDRYVLVNKNGEYAEDDTPVAVFPTEAKAKHFVNKMVRKAYSYANEVYPLDEKDDFAWDSVCAKIKEKEKNPNIMYQLVYDLVSERMTWKRMAKLELNKMEFKIVQTVKN